MAVDTDREVAGNVVSVDMEMEGAAKEAEHLIFATLDIDAPGVDETIENLDAGVIAEIEGQLLYKLITDEQMSPEQLHDFLMEAERLTKEWQSHD